ncbi:maleylpyruvate isomerase family mycothiol-dependent enzyme [Pseudonocardia saturnea]
MDAIMQALGEQHGELDGLLAGLDDRGWARPVPDCPGWSVTDVVLHLAQTDELVVSAVDGGFAAAAERIVAGVVGGTVDDAVGRMVEHERGAPGPEVHARWRAAAAAVRDLLAGSDPRRPLPWVVTDLPARTMATTRLSECWIHTHDVAVAVGARLTPGDRLRHIARLAVRTVPYAFARAGLAPPAGPVAARLTAPDGSTWAIGAEDATTTVLGPALDFCLVAARRLDPESSGLTAQGPDATDVLRLVRTYA